MFTKHFVFSMGSSSSFYCDIIFCYHNLCTHVLLGIGYTQFFTIIKSAILGALIHTFWCSHANISLGYKPRLYCWVIGKALDQKGSIRSVRFHMVGVINYGFLNWREASLSVFMVTQRRDRGSTYHEHILVINNWVKKWKRSDHVSL